MATLHFKATIEIRGINPYVLVSSAQARQLKKDWRKPMPVLIKVNGQPAKPWRINMMPVGDGSFYLYLHGSIRKASGTAVDDRVTIDLSFDDSYNGGPLHPLPSWLEKFLDVDATAKQNWSKFTPSLQKEVLRYFAGLKSTSAKQRNKASIIRILSGKETRFLGRNWKDGKQLLKS